MTGTQVVSINLGRKLAMMDDGHICQIVAMFDLDGDDTEDPGEAVGFSCGPTSEGKWVSDVVETFSKPRTVN